MNRSITLIGVAVVFLGFFLIGYPLLATGVEQIDDELQLGILVLPVGLAVILWGASSPDPSVTTVGGLFGNPDENWLRKRLPRGVPVAPARYLPGPRESTNCATCYTMIPWDVVVCPRCSTHRRCRNCAKPLYFLAGTVRCGPCVREEVYCHCPRVARAGVGRIGSVRGPRR